MITLQDRIIRLVENGIEDIPPTIRAEIYAISFYHWFIDDDARRPALSVSYNTESQVRDSVAVDGLPSGRGRTRCAIEARWNFAFWLQERGTICEFGEASLDRRIALHWAAMLGCPPESGEPSGLEEDDDSMEMLPVEFLKTCVECAKVIHLRGILTRELDRIVPIIVHDLEATRDNAENTLAANPPGLVDEYIRGMVPVEWVPDIFARTEETEWTAPQPEDPSTAFRGFSKLNAGLPVHTPPHKSLTEREQIAWKLHEAGNEAGAAMLGDMFLTFRNSFAGRVEDAVTAGRALASQGFAALTAKPGKSDWDWYWLGMCHGYGRGTPPNHVLAAECFRNAYEMGNEFAEYEEIWFAYLGGGSAIEAVFRLRRYAGPLKKYAAEAARCLSILAHGPVKEIGTEPHLFRILELGTLRHNELFHDIGRRRITTAIQAEMETDLDLLKAQEDPLAALALFLLATTAPRNPTKEPPETWLRKAVNPENLPLLALVEQLQLTEMNLKTVIQTCRLNGWDDCRLARSATEALALL
jgi:hypothetical protein